MPLGKSSSTSGGQSCSSKQPDNPINKHANLLPSDLRPIRDKAKGLYERITTEGYVEDEGDIVAVSGLAEDLRDVLLEYWVSVNPEKLIRLLCR
jgi:hypothetical protein